MSTVEFTGIVVADKDTAIRKDGELVHIQGWLLAGDWESEEADSKLASLTKSYEDEPLVEGTRVLRDSRGTYFDVAIRVRSIAAVRAAKLRLRMKMSEYLKVVATIQ